MVPCARHCLSISFCCFDYKEPRVQSSSLDFGRVIEIVTRVYMAHRKATNGELSVTVSDSFEVSVDRKGPMTVSFDRSGITEVSLGHHTIQSVYQSY